MNTEFCGQVKTLTNNPNKLGGKIAEGYKIFEGWIFQEFINFKG